MSRGAALVAMAAPRENPRRGFPDCQHLKCLDPGRFRVFAESEMKNSPLPGFGLHPDVAAVALNDPFADRQADTGTRSWGVATLKQAEDFTMFRGGNPYAVIAKQNFP